MKVPYTFDGFPMESEFHRIALAVKDATGHFPNEVRGSFKTLSEFYKIGRSPMWEPYCCSHPTVDNTAPPNTVYLTYQPEEE